MNYSDGKVGSIKLIISRRRNYAMDGQRDTKQYKYKFNKNR